VPGLRPIAAEFAGVDHARSAALGSRRAANCLNPLRLRRVHRITFEAAVELHYNGMADPITTTRPRAKLREARKEDV
jgi:hypothetical protein